MARLGNTILDNKAYGERRSMPMVDLVNGGQFGQQTDFPGYVSSAQYVRRNLIARVIETPRGFEDLPDPDKWREAYRALIELHPKTIEGFNSQLTVEVASTPFGGSGEEMETPSNVTRNRSVPNLTWVERYGRPISMFWDMYIMELIMDPITKIPNVMTRAAANGKPQPDMLPDYIGGTVLFFEPDPTFTKIDKAWLVTNFWPKTGAPAEARRDLTSAGDQVEFSIEFAAISQIGNGVNKLAQKMLDEMNITGANPNNREAFVKSISADLTAAMPGVAEKIKEAAGDVVSA